MHSSMMSEFECSICSKSTRFHVTGAVDCAPSDMDGVVPDDILQWFITNVHKIWCVAPESCYNQVSVIFRLTSGQTFSPLMEGFVKHPPGMWGISFQLVLKQDVPIELREEIEDAGLQIRMDGTHSENITKYVRRVHCNRIAVALLKSGFQIGQEY